MSIICPNCQSEEPEGSLFCSKCGTRLVDKNGLTTAGIGMKPGHKVTELPLAPEPLEGVAASLHIVRTGQILPLVGRNEFTIGRVSEGQSILPDVDLAPYDAYSQGVSRLHVTIKISAGKVTITDLGSSNGTRINNTRIPPHKEQALNHGDVITLGAFKLQALLHQE